LTGGAVTARRIGYDETEPVPVIARLCHARTLGYPSNLSIPIANKKRTAYKEKYGLYQKNIRYAENAKKKDPPDSESLCCKRYCFESVIVVLQPIAHRVSA
jgi:hypothetical protein